MPSYSHTTFAQLKTQLAGRLGDPGKTFWTDDELGLYIQEALRTWGSTALYWKDRDILETVSDQAFYDISSLSTLAPSLQDVDVARIVEHHLLEPLSTTTWTGTEQFSLTDLLAATQRRLDQFLLDTGVRASYLTVAAPSPGNGRVDVPETVADIRRVSWAPQSGGVFPLYDGDTKFFDAVHYRWSLDPGTPVAYSIVSEHTLTLQLAPVQSEVGSINLVAIEAGEQLDFSTEVVLGIPDDLVWVLKWGVLAELLSKEGITRDPQRAEYCQQRWEEGLLIAREYPSILHATVNSIQVPLTSLFDLDTAIPSWESTSDAPSSIAIAGRNLVALYPVPGSVLEIELDVVANAPIPEVNSDKVQVGKEYLSIILDYAHHLAAFKMGGSDFLATTPLYQNFMNAAIQYNSRLEANSDAFDSLKDQTQKEESQNPRFATNAQ
jgi:hypothetical protein